MSQKYIFEIGIEGIRVEGGDDLFEAEIELTDEEYDQIRKAYVDYFWDDDDLSELFRDYLPALNKRICALAEPFAVAKYGEKAKLRDGVWYEVLTPKEIEKEYDESDNYKEFKAAKEQMQENCREQSKYEHDILARGVKEGRWPHFTKAGQFDLFACYRAISGMHADYSMEGQCNGMHIDYIKRYKLKESKMEINFYGSKEYAIRLIDEYLKSCGREIETKDMGRYYMVYIPAKEDSSDISILLPILDHLEADAEARECL